MITQHMLVNLAKQYTGDAPPPGIALFRCSLILEAMEQGHDIGMALYYGYYFELGETLGAAVDDAKHLTTKQDVYDSMKEELDEYCEPSWQSKLKQLAKLTT